MAKSDHLQRIGEMLHGARWAAMATVDKEGLPNASMVAYAIDSSHSCLYLHLSGLAAHTREILQQPAIALIIGECDTATGDPQQLARLSLRGRCMPISRDSAEWEPARQCYLAHLPDAEQLFSFSDFLLFRFEPESVRFVGGFGQAHSYRQSDIQALL